MKISVIITTYNSPAYLKKALEGFLCQKIAPDELIVADDGSDEDTAKLIASFSKILPFPLLHVWHEDKGFRLAKIRNEAIKQATGNYIIFLDGDCIPGRRFISEHILLTEKGFFCQGKRLLLAKEASKGFDASHANSTGRLLRLLFSGEISNAHHLLRAPFFPAFKNRTLRGMKGCNMGFYKDDLLAVNGFNEDFIGWGREDSEIAIRLFRYGLKRKVHPFMAVCFHLWHKENPKSSVEANDKLLSETLSGNSYWCINGIQKKEKP